jgi:hypothetical protein
MDDFRLREIQLWVERDVLGAMLINGSMTIALLKHLNPDDFRYKHNREVYRSMFNLQHYGKFETTELLGEQSKEILTLMEDCLPCNADTSSGILEVKCQWLLDQSIRRLTGDR